MYFNILTNISYLDYLRSTRSPLKKIIAFSRNRAAVVVDLILINMFFVIVQAILYRKICLKSY
jgi:hypothetical protein